MPALRLVKVQLRAARHQDEDFAADCNVPVAAAAMRGGVAEYDARRCAVCGVRYPSFGFGTPLTVNGGAVWSCGLHRQEVEQGIKRTGTFSLALPLDTTESDAPKSTRTTGPAPDPGPPRVEPQNSNRQTSLF